LIGVGWDLNSFDADTFDLDVSCFLLGKNGKTRENEDFIFYNNLEGCGGAVAHNGDNRTGAGDGDDESISINLNGIPYDIVKILFVFSIYNGIEKAQGLEKLRNSYIRLVNASNSHEICRYEVAPDVEDRTETAMYAACLKREGPKWHFEALGECIEGGLAAAAREFDIIPQGEG
jgi:tellurium resistance protein TerD